MDRHGVVHVVADQRSYVLCGSLDLAFDAFGDVMRSTFVEQGPTCIACMARQTRR